MSDIKEQILSKNKIRNKTLVSFLFFFLFIAGCIAGWKWLQHQPKDSGALRPLRAVLNTNENIFSFFISNNHQAKSYPAAAAESRVRVNGDAGMDNNFNPLTWKLQLVRKPGDTLLLSIDDIKALPKTDIIFDFKCIEGWSQVTHWGGVTFSDFVKKYSLDEATIEERFADTRDTLCYATHDNQSAVYGLLETLADLAIVVGGYNSSNTCKR